MRSLYAAVSFMAGPPLKWWTARRISAGKDLPHRATERFGKASQSRPKGAVIWAHAASLGESRALFPVIDHLLSTTHATVLFTTATVTSGELVSSEYPERVIHQFAPYDRASWISTFLDHWRPDLALRAESEIWPNSFAALGARGTPLIMVNAKLRATAARRWKMSGRLAQMTFPAVSLALCQDDAARDSFLALGAKAAFTTGDIKTAAVPLPCNDSDLSELQTRAGDRPVWIAASTHGGEDPLVVEVHQNLKQAHPNLLTLIAPRHPDRGALIATDAKKADLNIALRSRGEDLQRDTDVYIVDTIGELGLFYRLSQVAFVGKSLTGEGGQNPSEPALLGNPVCFGPQMQNFVGIAKALVASGGAKEVTDAGMLEKTISNWLSDQAARDDAGKAARETASQTSTALDETLSRLSGYIDDVNQRYELPAS